MLILTDKGLADRDSWQKKGYQLPNFDRRVTAERTEKSPFWVHFGAGNIFRAFMANDVQKLLNQGILDRGLIVAEGYDPEIIERIHIPCDNLSILATLKADGSVEKTVIGSILQSLILDPAHDDFSVLKEIFAKESLQLATFTITEKGYVTHNGTKQLLPVIEADLEGGPAAPGSYLGKIAALLYERYIHGALPIAMVSMDNCSHNGDKLLAAMTVFARGWSELGLCDPGFLAYIHNPKKVSFPWTMIDKITPRPDPHIQALLEADGVGSLAPIITAKNTYVAPFVNAEECEYLVIEDHFPNGRPPLEHCGFIFTDRQTVDKAEKMKVCTCLNPLHTTLAIFGCLLGYDRMYKTLKDEALKRLVQRIGYEEGLPVVTHPGILDPKTFIDTVVNVRIPNPFMPDTPQRIATDTSQKLSIRFGETIKAYAKNQPEALKKLTGIPFVFAGWLRYLMGIDDQGMAFALSPDPALTQVCPFVEGFSLGTSPDPKVLCEHTLKPLLENPQIFGVNLYETGLAPMVCDCFSKMLAGPGAVRAALEKYI